jgi:release factor glutamine methyltransferase
MLEEPAHPTLNAVMVAARGRLEAAGIEDAEVEAEVLLRHALAFMPMVPDLVAEQDGPAAAPLTRAQLFNRLNDPIEADEAERYQSFLDRRIGHEPTAYITGHREFFGHDFRVTPAVLIPRPDTETLVEAVIDLLKQLWPERPEPSGRRSEEDPRNFGMRRLFGEENFARMQAMRGRDTGPLIAELGTGSGAIVISLALSLPAARFTATDVSQEALDVAVSNARRHHVQDRISFRQGDLLDALDRPFDVIVANLPYVNTDDWTALPSEIRDYEPRLALDGGEDGLDLIRRCLRYAPDRLQPGGAVFLEFGAGQEQDVLALAYDSFPSAVLRPDLGGRSRVLVAR